MLLEKKYKALIEKYGITDISLDKIMDSFYTPLYRATDDFDTAPERLLKMREIVAKSIMSQDDFIISVLMNTSTDDYSGRTVRIYGENNANVIIDGQDVTGVSYGNYSVYEAQIYSYPNVRTVTVSVNGTVYERMISELTLYEYNSYNEKVKNENSFDVSIKKEEVSSDGYTVVSTVIVSVPEGSTVSMDGKLSEDGTFMVTSVGKEVLFVKISVSLGSKTEIFRNIFELNSQKIDTLVDLNSEKAVSAINALKSNKPDSGTYEIMNSEINITFSDILSRFTIPKEAFNELDFNGYTYVRIKVRNNQPVLSAVPVLAIAGPTSMEIAEPDNSTMLIPGESRIVYYKIPLASDGSKRVQNVNKIVISSPESKDNTLSYTITDIQVVK